MTRKDPNIDQLYQEGNKAQPPKALDDAIRARAEQAHQPSRLARLRPWLAAASVLFAVPFLWLMLEQPELQQARQESLQPEPAPSVSVSADRAKPSTQAKTSPSADTIDPQDKVTDHGTITVTGSRIRRQDPESDTTGENTPAPAEKKRTDAREEQVMTEFKAEHEADEDDLFGSTAASYATDNLQIKDTSASLADLIAQLKPDKLTKTEQAVWQDFQQHIKQQQWSESMKTLKQLKRNHSTVNWTVLEERIKQLIKK